MPIKTYKKEIKKSLPFNPNQLPPQDIEAEQSVLGALLIDKDAVIKIADIITAKDFYRRTHEIIFESMMELYAKSEPIDLLTVSSKLKEKKQFKDIGGMSYLTTLVNFVPTASNVAHYAKIVNQKRVLRDLISASGEISALAWNETGNIDEILDEAEKRIFGVSQTSLIQEFQHIKPHLTEAFERFDRLHKGDDVWRGIPTGFLDLDKRLAGLQKADLIILAARPSLGKTSLALDIARHAAVNEKMAVGVFSLEMSKQQLIERLIAAEANVDLWRLRTGQLSDEGKDNDFDRIGQALNSLSSAPIYIDDAASPNVLQIRTMARRLQAEKGLDLLIIDYLQLMQGTGRIENRTQEVSEISRSLKNLARELNIPVMALSQLSRAPEARVDQVPKLSDLRESGAIEQDADVVMFIYREDKAKPNNETDRKNIAEIHVAKHRNGPTGKTELYFNENYVSFKNLDKLH
ncbi:MAG: primary replicative DNA helicase, replicative DNA helicase [Parcubacteria group bacterium GW2011_GWC1_43_61]|nr:MAG: Replicative DNA helicase [Candidatus Azambacteria bacterium GW2011_GWD1_43_18]KKT12037.1 MAG: Replicative DNA helicase [Candidatus Azambacteria bacterium GW2011_GWC2_43_27]KKT17133.1 MAG: primary replicative DNA helicase, replicative DNA helicase [Parcubacteria group bacterium GW2011_GWC1_43_61]OGD41518.1 MAG: replicative DNA helicase [Candidatus Azambacteria bacterium RIFOXYB1_FULL_40_33]OGD42891.1 MAG: replicative DNA helicase [Candidatus Azambacteria bacterium RIFOXYA1_FULL_42_37]OG